MEEQDTRKEPTQQGESSRSPDLRTYCLLCWRQIDLDLDRRGKLYAFCAGCGTRIFLSRTTLDALKTKGLAWIKEPPLETLRLWLEKTASSLGLEDKDGNKDK